MENTAHAAEMTTLEDADDITELVWDRKRLPRKMGKIKINCGLGSIAWSFGELQFITNPYIKRCRRPRQERLQFMAKDGCVQPAWEGAQAPIVHVLICYSLLPVSDEHKLSPFKGAVNDCVTFTKENTCKSLIFLLSFRKLI